MTSSIDEEGLQFTVVLDYTQNMELPWFGCLQPGGTYNYTPLTVNI